MKEDVLFMKSKVHVIISGRVQGVWFRAYTKQKAVQLGLTGWVRNTLDGNVEAVFEGEENLIQEMLDWCHHGPPSAEVEKVEVEKQTPSNDFDQFSIKY
jgi:acylphosphatase